MAPSVKTFQSDDSVLDPAIKTHIASLYAAVDNKDLEFWGSHFTEDAVMKKGATNVRGRASKITQNNNTTNKNSGRPYTLHMKKIADVMLFR